MQTELSKQLGVEHAIFGFTPFPAVAAAISRAGGFGVLGAVRYTAPDDLKRDLDWMRGARRRHALRPRCRHARQEGRRRHRGRRRGDDPRGAPAVRHRDRSPSTACRELAEGEVSGWRITGWMEQVARNQLDVAFDYPIKLLANALGSPPADVVERAHERGVLVAALAGSARHARKHARGGHRHRRRPGLRGGRPHRGDRLHGAHAGGRGRRRPAARTRGGRHRQRCSRWPPRSASAPRVCGSAPYG